MSHYHPFNRLPAAGSRRLNAHTADQRGVPAGVRAPSALVWAGGPVVTP
jgi:hypothetical protein